MAKISAITDIDRRAFFTTAGRYAAAGLLASSSLGLFAPVAAQAALASLEELTADRLLGDENAPVTIIEYSSLTCPHCAAFHRETLPQLKADYIDTGKAKLYVRDYPLEARAAAAAMITRCAPPQHYHRFIDILFSQQAQWAGSSDVLASLGQLGKLAGMPDADIQACFQNSSLFEAISNARTRYGQEQNIRSTPTFFINGDRIEGAQPYEAFKEAIESHL